MDIMMRDKIEHALDERVRPYLMDHEGDIVVLDFKEGILRVQLTGQCSNCPAASATTEEIVKAQMMDAIPEIKDVILDDGITEDMIAFAKKLLNHEIPMD